MASGRVLITGATGMVGSLLARRAAQAGYRVQALVRSTSKRSDLAALGVELVEGDLAAPETLPPVLEGAEIVVHSAAHVGDWGRAEKYRAINVYALEHMLAAVQRQGSFQRWVQVSSLGVYSPRDHFGTDETTPPDVNGLDGYTRTKAEAEILLSQHMRQNGLPAVIVRPGFIYGPGDRHVLPRLIERINAGKMKLFGNGQKLLNNTYVGNLVDALLLAMEHPAAVGETFNIRDERLVTRQEFVGAVADYLGQPRPGSVPMWLARPLVNVVEGVARALGRKQAPVLTKARLKFLTLNLDFSIAKARDKLGYQPKVDFQAGIREALDWATGKTSPHADR